jgi:hypothetical protein
MGKGLRHGVHGLSMPQECDLVQISLILMSFFFWVLVLMFLVDIVNI